MLTSISTTCPAKHLNRKATLLIQNTTH